MQEGFCFWESFYTSVICLAARNDEALLFWQVWKTQPLNSFIQISAPVKIFQIHTSCTTTCTVCSDSPLCSLGQWQWNRVLLMGLGRQNCSVWSGDHQAGQRKLAALRCAREQSVYHVSCCFFFFFGVGAFSLFPMEARGAVSVDGGCRE